MSPTETLSIYVREGVCPPFLFPHGAPSRSTLYSHGSCTALGIDGAYNLISALAIRHCASPVREIATAFAVRFTLNELPELTPIQCI